MYVDSGGEIARYVGGSDGLDDGTGEDIGEHVDGHVDEEEDRDREDDRVCFRHSSRRCRCSRFLDWKTFSECLQDGLLQVFSCVCRLRRVVEEMRHCRAYNSDRRVLDMLILSAAELSAAMLAELAAMSAET